MSGQRRLTNYVSYLCPPSGFPRVGSLLPDSTIQPLPFATGTPLENLYQVVILGNYNDGAIISTGDPLLPTLDVKILPPFTGRDILAVGKNYSDHAKEFNKSGYDASDKVDQPTHPVIFTKKATSIIGNGEEIYPHPKFSQSLDYEGEIGVVVGRSGFRIRQKDAMDHFWGYTIINDITARERQRDHKQFITGKSPDTFCPVVNQWCAHL